MKRQQTHHTRRSGAALLALALLGGCYDGADAGEDEDAARANKVGAICASVDRIEGPSRYDTAVAVSQAHFPGARAAVLVTGDASPDQLVAAPLAHRLGGPLLLTTSETLPGVVEAELRRLAVDEVYIVGGADVVGRAIETRLQQLGIAVRRIEGPDRYATSIAIAETMLELGASASEVYVASGSQSSLIDALVAAGPAAAANRPLLLVDPSSIPASVQGFLDRRTSRTVVFGGENAVSRAVFDRLPDARRVSGPSRFDTAIAAARFADDEGMSISRPFIVGADATVDAAAAAALGRPILLADTAGLPGSVADFVAQTATHATVVGGADVVSYDAEAAACNAVGDPEIEGPRGIRYVVMPHPDDEGSAWTMVHERPDLYTVFIVMTRGEGTGHCDGKGLQAALGERRPQGGSLDLTNCGDNRIDSFHAFLDAAADVDEGLDRPAFVGTLQGPRPSALPSRVNANGVRVEATTFELWVGDQSARAVFDLGDGDLTPSEVSWAIEAVRAERGRFPIDAEVDLVGSAYFNRLPVDENGKAISNGSTGYPHPDHAAIHDAMRSFDHGLPGPQFARTWSGDPAISLHRALPRARFDALYGVGDDRRIEDADAQPDASRTGIFQQAYGWLRGTYWPAAEFDDEAHGAVFTRQEHFVRWY